MTHQSENNGRLAQLVQSSRLLIGRFSVRSRGRLPILKEYTMNEVHVVLELRELNYKLVENDPIPIWVIEIPRWKLGIYERNMSVKVRIMGEYNPKEFTVHAGERKQKYTLAAGNLAEMNDGYRYSCHGFLDTWYKEETPEFLYAIVVED